MESHISIDSRIISHLGEMLISDEKVALLELVKNSSDADALKCEIVIDTIAENEYGKGLMIVEDNGNGMNRHIIESGFLRIATSFKQQNQKYSYIFNRLALGSKGVGRLALNRLGYFIIVETKLNLEILNKLDDTLILNNFGVTEKQKIIEENENYYYRFVLNWSDFEVDSLTLDSIPIVIQKIQDEKIKFCGESHGTRITIMGLKGNNYWEKKETKVELEKDVLAFMNPFQDKKANFSVKIDLNKEIFKSDLYDKTRIENIASSKTKFKFNLLSKFVEFEITRSLQYIEGLVSNMRKRMEDLGFELKDTINFEELYKKHCNVKPFRISILEQDINKRYSKVNLKSLYQDDKGEYFLPGDFEGAIYAFSRSSTEIKKLLESISGVNLYRNNFRVMLGEQKDWLGLGHIERTYYRNIYSPNNVVGYVYIDGEENLEKLAELTNREGLKQDEYGKNFLTLMRDFIAIIMTYEDDKFREIFELPSSMRLNKLKSNEIISFDDGLIKFQKIEDSFGKFKETIDEKTDLSEKKIANLIPYIEGEKGIEVLNLVTTDIKKEITEIKSHIQSLENDQHKKYNQIELERENLEQFYPLIGATIVAETLAHEITRLSNGIKFSSLQLRKLLFNNEEVWRKAERNLSLIDSNTKFLNRYAAMLDINSYSKRRRYEVIDLKEYLLSTFEDSPLLSYKNINVNLEIKGEGFKQKVVKEGLKIIFENLIINSVYWLSKMQINNPTINIQFRNNNKIQLWDNGFGIHNDISDKLFEPFVSNKPLNEGRGMGLYIVKEMLKEVSGDIQLLNETNSHDNRYKFEIIFRGELQ
ncbi:ATP-binding protein [Lysinibacillus piscis]|uniref:histidine kinase n=1 Tax=Lysinibacillus piscis TaxID=2518931 RepID=A0ABQ5NNK9_9BACI|nr:ATP-binding protein [Lysinibacillus sp. KH24]GLC89703.1 histidine kinase [Lysinibacillus sp. KH24]